MREMSSKESEPMYSREEILGMVAGRELDARVAKDLYGAQVVTKQSRITEGRILYALVNENKQPFEKEKTLDSVWWRLKEEQAWEACPRYSTDIAASWEVVEKITSNSEWMLYRIGNTDESGEIEYECTFLEVQRGVTGNARAKTAPEAIVKAALLSLLKED